MVGSTLFAGRVLVMLLLVADLSGDELSVMITDLNDGPPGRFHATWDRA